MTFHLPLAKATRKFNPDSISVSYLANKSSKNIHVNIGANIVDKCKFSANDKALLHFGAGDDDGLLMMKTGETGNKLRSQGNNLQYISSRVVGNFEAFKATEVDIVDVAEGSITFKLPQAIQEEQIGAPI